ncbi:beta-lactamase/transpeptidase-like protein [Infundibulicybe gibba]|nr:beta-lactamase/transpeptidase-like protein [Infundibulicybe gibba]
MVTNETLFCIGSNSKLFTVVAAGLLIHNSTLEPQITWESKIASLLPSWGTMDPIATQQSTIIDLMSHRTGLPRHDFSYRPNEDVLSIVKKIKYLRPSTEFREMWQYNNGMYMVLSYLPTALLPSKPPISQYVKEHIFDPLGMKSTTYSSQRANASGHLADGMVRYGVNMSVDPYAAAQPRPRTYWSPSGEDGNAISGAGGVISNAIDMATWLQTLLSDGKHPTSNASIIPPEVLHRASTGVTVPQGHPIAPELSTAVYGGGQSRSSYRGHEMIEHGGAITGFHTQITRFPFDDLGVAVLSNDDFGGPIVEVIKNKILDDALGLSPIDWSSRLRAMQTPTPAAAPRPANVTLPSVEINSIAGRYHHPGYQTVELCLVSHPSPSDFCQELVSSAPTVLPGVLETFRGIPTFLGRWDSFTFSHIVFTHFDGDMFNVSALASIETADASEPFWTYGNLDIDSGGRVQVARDGDGNIGLGMTNVWGAGPGVRSPEGGTVEDKAEVWFSKLH